LADRQNFKEAIAMNGRRLAVARGTCALISWCSFVLSTALPSWAQGTSDASVPQYFRAKHGFDGGLSEMVDLSELEGFDAVRTIDDLAKFASEVPKAMGFTAHPDFENGTRYAHAVLWYTGLSSKSSSWPLHLFDRAEAQKRPGGAPQAEAVAAAEAKVSARMKEARELVDAGGASGVKLVDGDHGEKKALALAIMRLGGFFRHTGAFAGEHCHACRNVVPGGNPGSCGHGVAGRKHWNCCGGTDPKDDRCRYWELIKAQDDNRHRAPGLP